MLKKAKEAGLLLGLDSRSKLDDTQTPSGSGFETVLQNIGECLQFSLGLLLLVKALHMVRREQKEH